MMTKPKRIKPVVDICKKCAHVDLTPSVSCRLAIHRRLKAVTDGIRSGHKVNKNNYEFHLASRLFKIPTDCPFILEHMVNTK